MSKPTKYIEPNTSYLESKPKVIKRDLSFKDEKVASVFKLTYREDSGKKNFIFVLPPAVEHALQYTPSGMLKGNVQTPQTKPGAPAKTQIKVVSMGVPGGKPIQQVSGIQGCVYEFVGALTGGEITTSTEYTSPNSDYIYRDNNKINVKDPWDATETNAITTSQVLDKIVQKGREVTITIYQTSELKIIYTGIIAVFEQYFRWSNRVYYMIKMIGTRYDEDLNKPIS